MMINISKAAESMISQMISESEIANTFLRIGIEDGGCSGLSYQIKLDNTLMLEDNSIQNEGFKIVWDTRSQEYLQGLKIDYLEQGMTGGFTIDNPNAKATCGCGASFRTATFKGTRKKCD